LVLKTSDGSAKGLDLLKREYELSIGLSHPGLAYVFTYEEFSPVGPCLVQEFVDGETLAQWLSHKPGTKERRRVFSELLSVVGYLHQKGIIHNDLKPDNILITRSSGTVKLIDLGFSDNDSHTRKALGGTPGYASPELLAGGARDGGADKAGAAGTACEVGAACTVDARSDIYSLGVILRDLFPHRYGCIVRRCLNRNPARRYPSAEALGRALDAWKLPVRIALGLLFLALLAHLLTSAFMREREESRQNDALENAKAQVEAVYEQAIPAYRQALREATTLQDVTAAWLAFGEQLKQVNFDIPSATPESVRPALRDYIIERNTAIQNTLSDEMAARIREIQMAE
ncbi:MAG: serine/threonine protein kinase, partial [Bacteroidales bacterium]|nr:serine/threonine protein kinase [Bacteroidales bacterium]